MNLEADFGIDAKKESAIVDFFKPADRLFRQNRTELTPLIAGGYQKEFGPLNFAALELIFREHHLHTHFLAIQSEFIEKHNPHVIVVDVNDILDGITRPRPFVAIALANLDETEDSAQKHGFTYSPNENIKHLKFAGIYTSRPGFDVVTLINIPRGSSPMGWTRRN